MIGVATLTDYESPAAMPRARRLSYLGFRAPSCRWKAN